MLVGARIPRLCQPVSFAASGTLVLNVIAQLEDAAFRGNLKYAATQLRPCSSHLVFDSVAPQHQQSRSLQWYHPTSSSMAMSRRYTVTNRRYASGAVMTQNILVLIALVVSRAFD